MNIELISIGFRTVDFDLHELTIDLTHEVVLSSLPYLFGMTIFCFRQSKFREIEGYVFLMLEQVEL